MARRRFSFLRLGWRLLLLALLGGGWLLAVAALHLVVVPEGGSTEGGWKVLVVPKNRLALEATYTDTRAWTPADVEAHEILISRLVESGHGEHLAHILDVERRRQLDLMLRQRREAIADE